MQPEKIELFAIIELFGHTRISGLVTEYNFGGATFIRVDVPETKQQPSFTRMLNPSAIYAINPVAKDVMEYMAETIQTKPIEAWDIKKMQEMVMGLLKEKPVTQDLFNDENEN